MSLAILAPCQDTLKLENDVTTNSPALLGGQVYLCFLRGTSVGPLSAKEIRQWEELKQREERARRGHQKRKPYQRHHLDKRAGQLLAESDPREGNDDLLETREVADWIGVSYEWRASAGTAASGPLL